MGRSRDEKTYARHSETGEVESPLHIGYGFYASFGDQNSGKRKYYGQRAEDDGQKIGKVHLVKGVKAAVQDDSLPE